MQSYHIEKQGAVAHTATDNMADTHAAPAVAKLIFDGSQAATRFQSKQAAAGSGNTNRPAAVGCVCYRYNACGDCCSGAAAGAARRIIRIPRITGCAVCNGLCGQCKAELWCIGLAQNDQSGIKIFLHNGSVLCRDKSLVEAASVTLEEAG